MTTSPDDSPDLNKLDLFIKLMRMTDAEDTVTLVAIRKANQLLKTEGWDWDKLLRSKIRIISNPFAGNGHAPAPMQTAQPARRAAPQPAPAARQAPAATNPWPAGSKPTPRPYTPRQPTAAPPGPLHFRKSSKDKWCIASHQRLVPSTTPVTIIKKDGSQTSEMVGPYVEQTLSGHYLYEIAGASKWQKRNAGGPPTIDDLI